ncbi:hypothetical protein [Geobacter sp. SVR]|nr:hypothetical protein [Geobacter sp. SVR]BCS52633.1 cell division protein FtsZ [Geobacter sp. SVR]GCF83930.1 cell division protein FtsZ [Geobacter sp. SVR]
MQNFAEEVEYKPVIKGVAVGDEACNILDTLIELGIHGVDFIITGTERCQLEQSVASVKVRLGHVQPRITLNPHEMTGADCESVKHIGKALADADMVFIISCLDDACGHDATVRIADYAEGIGAGVMCLVALPSHHEGTAINGGAQEALGILQSRHSVLVLPNGILVRSIIGGITDLVTKQRFVGIDCVDLKESIFRYMDIKVGVGMASGGNRAVEATKMALASPLLAGFDVAKAQSVVVSASVGKDASMEDFAGVDRLVRENVPDSTDCTIGLYNNGETGDQFAVMLYCCDSQKYPRKALIPQLPESLENDNQADIPPFLRT